ncbi:MAG: hypothetical protein CSB48_12095 [Proteobacteria bacterium]|nr:MAG: hypothetical protein CSB48_12095 [Pseudomonadota bacterium]
MKKRNFLNILKYAPVVTTHPVSASDLANRPETLFPVYCPFENGAIIAPKAILTNIIRTCTQPV